MKLYGLLGLGLLLVCATACTVPVPEADKFGAEDLAIDIAPADTPEPGTDTTPADTPDLATDTTTDEPDAEGDIAPDAVPDTTPDLVDDTNPDVAPDLGPDGLEDADIGVPDTTPDIPLPTCTTATDCDDDNPCTDDTCNPETGCAHQPNTLVCTDNDACTTNTTCQNGACAGPALACDDANPCTDDTCDKLEGCVYLPNSVTCTDGNACTQADTCADSFCKGTALECDDLNPCTDDACSKATGCITIPTALPCNDGDACTTSDSCTAGTCQGGAAQACDDGIPCTLDGCDPSKGCTHVAQSTACDDQNPCTADDCQVAKGCAYAPAAGPCDDGQACTTGDACAAGKCSGGQWTCACVVGGDCDDKDPCTTDACKDGVCVMGKSPDNIACDDGDACVAGEACQAGKCAGGASVVCDDGNACTFDGCDPKAGCLSLAHTLPCDDGDPCTVGDACAKKACVSGTAKNCADGNACTDDGCEKGKGCKNTPNTKACDDDNACTVGDACKEGACAGAVLSCDDGFACTTDSCNSGAGSDPCVYAPKNSACDDKNGCTDDSCQVGKGCVNASNVAPCDDGNVCTKSDVCSSSACQPGAHVCVCKVEADCDDKNPCTKDACEGGLKCTNTAVADGGACDDGNACTASEACAGGKCAGGKAVTCDDGNACTADSCEQATGCKHANTTVACDDADACTVGEACGGGACVGGVAKACDDGNLCTTDGCEKASGCVNVANTDKCDDGDACTSVDACQDKVCVGAVPPQCDDGNACTTDGCVKSGGCVHLANSEACDDGDACTTVDACKAAKCVGAVPPQCDDGNTCTDDSCSKTSGCLNLANGVTCTDGDACTTGDACSGKACVGGVALKCDDGNACTDDSCAKASGCSNVANTAQCDDGDACTTVDACQDKGCGGAVALKCDDGNVCTDDSCLKASGCAHAKNTATCDDKNPCTPDDQCTAGTCVAAPEKLFGITKFGGTGEDVFATILETPAGYIAAGHVSSMGAGGRDAWVVSTDKSGKLLWQKTWGGALQDSARTAVAVSDGIVVGGTTSGSDIPGDNTGIPVLLKYDFEGNLKWNESHGSNVTGGNEQTIAGLVALEDGLLAVGTVQVAGNGNDLLMVRTTALGKASWKKTYGGGAYDQARTAAPMADGFLVLGSTGSKGNSDQFWLVRTDLDGKLIWDRTYGGSSYEYAYGIQILSDGYLLYGNTYTYGAGKADLWLVRTDTSGNRLWDRTFGGVEADQGYLLEPYGDGFLLPAQTKSKGAGEYDAWLLHVDASGTLQWDRTFGSVGSDRLHQVLSLDDGLLMAGFMDSDNVGKQTAWLARADPWGNTTCAVSGPCAAKQLDDCSDDNPCTTDLCDAAHNGCYHTNLPDWSPCGTGKVCDGQGTCNDVAAAKGMALIPGGTFKMGCSASDVSCDTDEKPPHDVVLASYYVDTHEVTTAGYGQCVKVGKCSEPGVNIQLCTGQYAVVNNWDGATKGTKAGREDHPVNCITWLQADNYCKSMGYRLPTEAEWERAARGGLEGKKFPWGDANPTCTAGQDNSAVFGAGGIGCGTGGTLGVGTASSANQLGIFDMAGNVWEYAADWYSASYYTSAVAVSPVGPSSGTERVIRGGGCASADGPGGYLRTSSRAPVDPSIIAWDRGFRCARSFP